MAAALVGLWAALVVINFPSAPPVPASRTPRWVAALEAVPGIPVPVPMDVRGLPAEWGRTLAALGWAATLAVAGCAAGRMVAPVLRLRRAPAGWSALLGLVAASATVLGLGFAGLSFPSLLRVLIAAGVAAGFRRAMAGGGGTAAGSPASALRIAGGVVVAAWIVSALNPEPGIDAYVYHLRLPSIYALHHRVHSVWHHIHSHVPQLWELPLVAVPALPAATCAQALSAATAWPVWRLFVALAGGGGGARAAGLLLLSSPLVLGIGASAYTDLPLVWLTLTAVTLLGAPSGRPSASRRFAAGLALGAASALKYAAFPAVAGCAVWLGVGMWRRRAWTWAVPAAAGFVAVFWPWPAWNGLAAGNPFTPFLGSWFPGALPALPFAERLSGAVFRRPWSGVAASPWTAYVACEPFLFVSPVLVALLPVASVRRGAAPWPGAGLWVAVFVLAWARMIADERFGLAVVAVCAAWAVRAGFCDRMARPGTGRMVFVAALALNLAAAVRQMWMPPVRIGVAAGLVSREAYWRATLPPAPGFTDAAAWINRETAEQERVLFVTECRSHLYRREAIHDHVIDHPTRLVWILAGAPPDPARIAARFRQLGIGWVLHLPGRAQARLRDMPDLMPFTPSMARSWAGFWMRHARPAHRVADAGVYRITPRAGPEADSPGLPGVQDLMLASAMDRLARGDRAGLLGELRLWVAAYPRVGAVQRMYGEALGALEPASLAEARAALAAAARIERAWDPAR